MAKLFFSYSHKDGDLRDELEIHLAALKREGVIETWHDRRIGAGKEFGREISRNLEEADIILLLISPYFIASDYCYENEMGCAMKRHDEGTAQVIPVILHPCDWQNLAFGKFNATPNDGKPISNFSNKHDGFLQAARAIRKAVEELEGRQKKTRTPVADMPANSSPSVPHPRSSNLRIKKEFTDHDKDRFLTDAFEFVATFFDTSLAELNARGSGITSEFRRVDANHFTTAVYRQGRKLNSCKIWMGGRTSFPNGIAYSTGDSHGDTSFNESLSVENDGYTMFLKPMGLAQQPFPDPKLTFEGAAEFLWSLFIRPLQ